MTKHLEREMSRMEECLMRVCAIVEQNLALAIESVVERNPKLAESVIGKDSQIDRMEVETEEECLKLLALYQPVAIDLRRIVAILKINNDLERIGDLTVNIAESSVYLATQKPYPDKFDFVSMGEIVADMLKNCVDALVRMDPELAAEVCAQDDLVDARNKEMYELVRELIKSGHDNVNQLIHLLSISRHLERIADHSTNIAEDVIYMIRGDIVRHQVENYLQESEPKANEG